ncbi:MAG: ATP-binding protein [Lysobacterales bacterium]
MDRLATLIISLTLMSSAALGQESFLKRDHWLVDHFTVDDGLPVNSVNALTWGPEGYLWIATFDGLVRFDGQRFVIFDRASHPELPGNRFTRLQWFQGFLWVITDDRRLVRMSSSGQFEVMDEDFGLPHAQVGRLLTVGGDLYAGTLAGIAKLRPGGSFEPFAPSFTGAVGSLAYWPEKGLAVGTNDGQLLLINPAEPPRILPLPKGLGRISSLAYFQGLLAVGASGGTVLLDEQGIHHYSPLAQQPMDSVRVVVFEDQLLAYAYPKQLRWTNGQWTQIGSLDRQPIDPGALVDRDTDGRLWKNHLYRLERSGQTLLETNSLISDFLIAPNGDIWVGANSDGLYRLRPRIVLNVGQPEGLGNPNLYALTEENGDLLAGSIDPVAFQVSLSGPKVSVRELSAPDGYYAFMRDRQGNRWRAGARICMTAPAQNACQNIDGLSDIQRHQFVYAMLQDSNGDIWIGAERSLAVGHPSKGWTQLAMPWRSLEVAFRTGLETPDGRVWFGTNGAGITLATNGAIESVIDTRSGLSSNRIRSLYFDPTLNAVWAASEDGGICRIRRWEESPEIRCISTRQGLWSNGVHQLLDDDQGRLWMSSNDGLFYAPMASLNAVADGTDDWVQGMAFDERDGMANREANGGGQNAGVKSSNGWLWFPTQKGLAGIHPASVSSPAKVRVQIDSVVYDAAEHQALSTFAIAPENRNVEIRYSAPSFGNSKRVRYRYRLGGASNPWLQAGQRTFATLTSLPAGEIRFDVEVSGEDGSWSGQRDHLTLQVLPKFHETVKFTLLLTVLALGLITLAGWWRIRRFKVRQQELQLAVDKRTHELSEAVEQISRQRDEIETNAKARSRLFGSISHELRTPLSLILGPMEERAQRRRAVTAEDEAMMLRNARRLNRMVDQILDLERVESGVMALNLEPISCSEVVRAVSEPFAGLAEAKDIGWELDVANGCPVVGDREQLENVFSNLFSNAVKYTPKGGTVRVRVSSKQDRVLITVEDSGPGIDAEDRDEAFARFSRLKRDASEPGTGIGLSLVQELIELHRGTVRIDDSASLGGALLQVELPRLEQVASTKPESTAKRQVLVVDDNPDLRTYVSSILSESFVVLLASDGMEALKMAREHLPDVIVTDVMMPTMNGLEMVAALRSGDDEAAIPVLFLTARGGASDEIAALAAGGDQFLAKPFDSEVLLARVNAVMASAERLRGRALPASPEPRAELERRIQNFVIEHLGDPELSVSAIASALGMSRSNLFRQVKSELNTTPTLLIRRIRLQAARAWLDDKELAISEIAYGTGFSSLSSFGRAFRDEFGVSASAYRQRQAIGVASVHNR